MKPFTKEQAAILRGRLYMGEDAEALAREEEVSVDVIQKLLVKKGDKPLDIMFRAGHDFDEHIPLWIDTPSRGFQFVAYHNASSLGVINGIFYIWMDFDVEHPIEHRFTWSQWHRYDGSACNLDKGIYKMYGSKYESCNVIKFKTPEKLQLLINYRNEWYDHLENKKKKK